ncbi:MAG: DUF2807 domain-containing protein [Amphiplicatus sp.]
MTLKVALIAALALAAGPAAAERFTADKVLFQDVTGAVEIVTTAAGDEVDVVIAQGKTHHPIIATLDKNGLLTVKGEKWKEEEIRDCCNERITRTFHPRQGREASSGEKLDEDFFADYPTITVTMPRRGDVAFIDARMKLKMDSIDGKLDLDACYVYGEAGDAGEAVIGVLSGSRLVAGNIGSGLEIDVSGDADVKVGTAASVDVDIAGTGDVVLGDIEGMLDITIAGSGTVRGTRLDGPLMVRIAGSGAVSVKEGRADRLKAIIDGSGAIFFDGLAIQPDLKLYGSAEVRLGSLSGRLIRAGGGEVYVAGKLVERK